MTIPPNVAAVDRQDRNARSLTASGLWPASCEAACTAAYTACCSRCNFLPHPALRAGCFATCMGVYAACLRGCR